MQLAEADDAAMLSDRRLKYVVRMYRDTFPDRSARDLRKLPVAANNAAPQEPPPPLDDVAYMQRLEEELIAAQQVSPEQLEALAANAPKLSLQHLLKTARRLPRIESKLSRGRPPN